MTQLAKNDFLRLLLELHSLLDGQDPEPSRCSEIREEMEPVWEELTQEEREETRWVSASLHLERLWRMIFGEPIQVPTVAPAARKEEPNAQER